MKFTATINHTDVTLESPRNRVERALRDYCKAKSIDWQSAEIFIANTPESGRYLQKNPGFASLVAGG